MPRWPANQVENSEMNAPPAAQKLPETHVYIYNLLNPEDAETNTFPYNGEAVIVSDDSTKPGMIAIWRSTRRREGWRWVKTGIWSNPFSSNRLPFEPICWRRLSKLED